jgi:hypothetical protein
MDLGGSRKLTICIGQSNVVMLLTVTIAACAALPRTCSGCPRQITTLD